MKIIQCLLGPAIVAATASIPSKLQATESARVIEEIVVTSRRRDESQQDVPPVCNGLRC